ncbi:hypothetical protein PAL_GLEAN10008213 [Pteropus alecto]|uniref:Uncharacterized protein n=1 Tax=Pteropus alecto TaxID=9402 RepID=L5K1A5_PTEAL|nr:hypothetical protein PAL_GLEAN10008213 [Pteropus alecto]
MRKPVFSAVRFLDEVSRSSRTPGVESLGLRGGDAGPAGRMRSCRHCQQRCVLTGASSSQNGKAEGQRPSRPRALLHSADGRAGHQACVLGGQPPPALFPKCLQVLTALHTLTLPSRSSSGVYGDCFVAADPSPDPDACYSTLYKVAKGIPQELKSDHAPLGMSFQRPVIKPKSFLLLARASWGQAPHDPSSPPGFLHLSLCPKCPLLAGLTHIF